MSKTPKIATAAQTVTSAGDAPVADNSTTITTTADEASGEVDRATPKFVVTTEDAAEVDVSHPTVQMNVSVPAVKPGPLMSERTRAEIEAGKRAIGKYK